MPGKQLSRMLIALMSVVGQKVDLLTQLACAPCHCPLSPPFSAPSEVEVSELRVLT